MPCGGFLDITVVDWDAVIAVKLKSASVVGQVVARAMTANHESSGYGTIVNMSSFNGNISVPTMASYNASERTIDELTRAMGRCRSTAAASTSTAAS